MPGMFLHFPFFPFYAWSIILFGILNVPYMFDIKCMPFLAMLHWYLLLLEGLVCRIKPKYELLS